MIKKIEHLGIAVNNIEEATKTYEALLNSPPYKTEIVEREGVKTVFFECGESKVELLGATREDSPVGKYLSKQKEGIHHIAFFVDDLKSEMKRLQKEGFQLLSEEPKAGADGKSIVFLHPKSSHGVLVELCED
ncbi:methylmalonyl-CoA epimerase [Psychroflexus lacisalsi]|jgi:methylmalonyl-CoA/ethylmalonyl-CoA epimerase|uniref:Methylmalonyl-CoA epimerase n=1 Tax=Psychroflexus lacisalsi TaxID=503928 RepID=A0ABN1K4M2_9FLAO|nr:methylmalonyl-CoA epimerase [Psychroflexus lacisalsi]MBZ9618972.1 methylmalonyl-CoA epimerase [Psychroflexus lacisalsi]